MSRIRKAQPTQNAVHVNFAITNMSVALLQDPSGFIAPQVFQSIPSDFKSDEYYEIPRGAFNRKEGGVRGPGGRFRQGGFEVSTSTFTCIEKGLEYPLPDQVVANADAALSMEELVSQYLTHQALIEIEDDFVSTFMTTGVWATEVSGSSTPGSGEVDFWDDYTDSDPIQNVRDAINTVAASTGIMPNEMAMGRRVFSALIDHPDIQGRINGGATTDRPSIANLNLLAQIFELDRITVGTAISNSAAEGATDSHDFIVPNSALLYYRPPSPGLLTPAAGYRFDWTGYMGGVNEFGFIVDQHREALHDQEVFRYKSHYTHKLISSELGYYFDTIVQG